MNEICLPPSPNWYLNNILSCSYDGTVAWGARNAIVIGKQHEGKIMKYSIIKNAYKDRVTSVAFIHQFAREQNNLLASTGDGDIIKIWNLQTLSIAYSCSIGNEKQAIGIDWPITDILLLYCLSSDGNVTSWNIRFDNFSTISLGKVTTTCLACCPHESNLVAVGSKSGLVYIVDFEGQGTIIYKLRGHDTEIVDLSWCPSEKNVINKSSNRDLLLASGGRDRSIFVWRAGGDGRYEIKIPMPTGPLDSHRHRSKLNASVGNWIAICWVKPNLLLTSSFWGELISWDLTMISKSKQQTCKLVHACHARGLFCIATVPDIQSSLENWREEKRLVIWTLAQDRQVVCCNVKDGSTEITHNISTQGGYVYCISACPLDTSQLAFGVGDAMIRLWNLSEIHSTCFKIIPLWQKVKGKVRAISWHPEKENLLAYATGEGRIGVFDINGNKPPTLYRQYHRNTVYALGWGPSITQAKQHVLYSCGEGELVFYDPQNMDEEPTCMLKKDSTEFSWKPDFSCLAVGFENGSISFFNHDLVECGYASYNLKKRVHCLVWHPESTATDLTYSSLRNYLAVASDSPTIIILDVSNFVHNLKKGDCATRSDNLEEKCDLYKVHEVVATLNGHSDKICCVAWSPHFSGHLVSGSYDNTAQVWNIETQELMGTYTGHYGPVLSCIWSPLHPDFIITGSADFTVQIWKITNQDVKVSSCKTATKSMSKKNKKKLQNKSFKNVDVHNEDELQNVNPNGSEVSASSHLRMEQKTKMNLVWDTKKKKTERMSYFTKNTKAVNDKSLLFNSILDLAKNKQSGDASLQHISCKTELSLFSTIENLTSFVNKEKFLHAEAGRHNIVTEMDIWCDNLKHNLEEAVKEKRLNDFLVALAPSLSIKTWKEICEAYANQLICEGNPQKAVSYLLCIHKTYKAIEVLEHARLYKDAYALARYKLAPDDSVLSNILEHWALHNVETGQFEQAAYIYAKLNDFSKTIKYLARRKDATSLSIAAKVALLCEENVISISLAEQAITEALVDSEYDVISSIITDFPFLKYQEVHLSSLKELKKVIGRKTEMVMVQMWLDGKSEYGLLQVLGMHYGSNDSYYTYLCQSNFNKKPETEKMMWLTVSHEIALAITCSTKQQQLKHFVRALDIVSHYDVTHQIALKNECNFLIEIIMKLDAKSPADNESIYEKTDCPATTSLRAYLCFGLLSWLVDNINETSVYESIENIIILIEDLLQDALNQTAIKYWSRSTEISKLEAQLSSTMGTMHGEGKNENNTFLIEKLSVLKNQKKQFIDQWVSTPNPIIVYGKANELISKLSDENMKSRFTKIVSERWENAIL